MVGKVRKLSNPRRRKPATAKRKNARRKMSAKQIKHFGTKAQRASLKRRRTKPNPVAKRRRRANAAPRAKTRTKIVYRTRTVKAKTTRRKRRKSNPLQMVTLGLVNPRKRGKGSMAKRRTKRKVNSARRTTTKRRRRNGTRVVVMGRRNTRRRSGGHRSRCNPSIAGVSGAKGVGELLLGGVGGVLLGKSAPAFLPAMLTGNALITAVVLGGIGYGAGMLVTKGLGMKNLGDGVMFGTWLEAAGQLISSFAPGLGLSGFVPAQFAEPENPVWRGAQARQIAAAAAAVPAGKGMQGVFSTYGGAY
jgi:hypothetical protein